MTFTPIMISATMGVVTVKPGESWKGTVIPKGSVITAHDDLGDGELGLTFAIRYDYGPYVAQGAEPSFYLTSDRVLFKGVPAGTELGYTEPGVRLCGLLAEDGVTELDVWVHYERDVLYENVESANGRDLVRVDGSFEWGYAP